jgi:sensor c-di-GMP phosphodiesterase-like protein
MNGIRRHAIAMPRPAAALVGLLVALLSLILVSAYLVAQQFARMDEQQGAAAAKASAIVQDSQALLQKLNANYAPDCSPANLAKFRIEVFATAAQVDVGVLGENGELLCTSLLGVLSQPVAASGTDLDLRSASGVTYQIAYNLPLVAGGSRLHGSIVRQGRFNTVINPKIMDQLFAMGQDVTQVVLPEGGSFPIGINPDLSEKWREFLNVDYVVNASIREFNWDEGVFMTTRQVTGTHFVLQSILPLQSFLQAHKPLISLVLLGALLVSLLAGASVLPVFRKWGTLAYRMPALLTEAHIICLYQPIVDLVSGKTVGCEVLMRLRDGDKVIFPDQALPVIVQGGLTWQLDQLVIRTALRELGSAWVQKAELTIAFNLFPENIHFTPLHAVFESEQGHISKHFKFEIEVIEQVYQSSMLDELAKFKRAGYLVAVDDFGTGYSNLGSVKNIAPDFLKIDKSFVFDMEDASVRSSLIPEIIGVAKAVGARLIAEGIENEGQRQLLAQHGVEYGQGYLFARPLPIDAFVAFVKQSSEGLP